MTPSANDSLSSYGQDLKMERSRRQQETLDLGRFTLLQHGQPEVVADQRDGPVKVVDCEPTNNPRAPTLGDGTVCTSIDRQRRSCDESR